MAQADVMVSGVVRKLERHVNPNRSSSYGAYIQINRVIKGHSLLFELLRAKQSAAANRHSSPFSINNKLDVQSSLDNLFQNESDTDEVNVSIASRNNTSLRRTKKFSAVGNTIYVRGFGSHSICDSRVFVGDYRIVLVRVDSETKHLFLNASVIRTHLPLSNYNTKQRAALNETKDTNMSNATSVIQENKCIDTNTKNTLFLLFSHVVLYI
jgi:hypothetical protein